MEQTEFTSETKLTKLQDFTKEELIQKYTIVESELGRLIRELYELKKQPLDDTDY